MRPAATLRGLGQRLRHGRAALAAADPSAQIRLSRSRAAAQWECVAQRPRRFLMRRRCILPAFEGMRGSGSARSQRAIRWWPGGAGAQGRQACCNHANEARHQLWRSTLRLPGSSSEGKHKGVGHSTTWARPDLWRRLRTDLPRTLTANRRGNTFAGLFAVLAVPSSVAEMCAACRDRIGRMTHVRGAACCDRQSTTHCEGARRSQSFFDGI
mmetsp:Transcript_67163/g.184212  ORF Transcript_67163/g.184212 Transcript_67163/m.184212 type:complete len:212 (+) Transcript_67163:1067-1702(+)